jgi:putative ABC transport system permease protein
MNPFAFAWRLFKRHWRAGELRILIFSVVVAVAAVSAVGFFTDRVQQALGRQSNQLLGADLALVSDHAITKAYLQKARQLGLATASAMVFPSMAIHGESSRLAEIKAVSSTYPLRGRLRISDTAYGHEHEIAAVPQAGTVWVEPRLLGQLHADIGDEIELGERHLKIVAVLRHEPDRGGDLFSIAPRLLMNESDVAGTGLIQFGSRVFYRMLLAGDDLQLKAFKAWATSRLQRGERLEDVSDARPEIRNVLTKARQFLGLSAMASVILASVAMALAGLRFITRNLDACAMMRCLGASQAFIVQTYLLQLLLVGLVGGLAGCVFGFLSQEILSRILGGLLLESLPTPSLLPVLQGLLTGVAVLLGITWPLLARLRNVPALRVLRSDLPLPAVSQFLAFLPAFAVLTGLVLWTAQDVKLGSIALAGMAGFLVLAALLTWLAVYLLRQAGRSQAGTWRFGVANLARHPVTSIATVAGFSLGLMALLLLTIVRGDLLRNWQATLPADAPNRFAINIQPDQLPQLRQYFAGEKLAIPTIQPMVKGRLMAVNERPLDVTKYDDRARRLAEREFNLSWSAEMQADNRIVAGRWWSTGEADQPQLSLEQGIAETLGLHLGDWLTYDIGGNSIKLQITSLRKVEWDSMRANFFAITPPGVLDQFPASYITSFYLGPQQDDVLNRLVREFPNVTVIDVAAIMTQVRSVMDRMANAVQFVFGFSLLAGVLVLYAALAATRDARMLEYTLLRVLGAKRRQMQLAMMTEFALIAALAGSVAACGAGAIAWVISRQVLHLAYRFDPMLMIWGIGLAVIVIPLAAWWGLRDTMNLPPRQILNSV